MHCPFCGGRKEVMSLVSGNTYDGTLWSDTRSDYPMLPRVSPIQQCPHCKKYYFMEDAKQEYGEEETFSFDLGKLDFENLKEAKKQMDALPLPKARRWVLNCELFMAYNDSFRRDPEKDAPTPGEEDETLYRDTIEELLDGIDRSEQYELFQAELLRETGRFAEASAVLRNHKSDDDKWIVDAMLRHIDQSDTAPFLLVKDGDQIL